MIKCNCVTKVYKRGSIFSSTPPNTALSEVSINMTSGRSLGVVGENGSGKSTLVRLVLGLEKTSAGEVLINGENINTLIHQRDFSFRKNIQAVFQDPASSLNPRWSAFRAISEPFKNFEHYSENELRDKVADLMKSVDLDIKDMDKNVTRFSGGQQQRICIARALALNPKVLILDEALSNLDIVVQAQIIELLENLKRDKGISLFVISHDIRVVFKLCEDIIVLEKGKVVEKMSIENPNTEHSTTFNKLMEAIG